MSGGGGVVKHTLNANFLFKKLKNYDELGGGEGVLSLNWKLIKIYENVQCLSAI